MHMEPDPIFAPGQTVTLQTHTPKRTLTFTIDKPFAPFSKAVVLLARSPELELELGPDPVVVKIYDPRFLKERFMDTAHSRPHPWSLEAERAADAIWDDEPFDDLQLYEDEPQDAEDRAARAALWEKYFRMLSTRSFEDERDAYDRLRPLQGTAIPRLLLTGTVLPPDERAIELQAIVLQYVADAVSLCDVPPELVTPELCAALFGTVDSFAGRGVVHGDLNCGNVLFAPSARPTRVVVIDFEGAVLRTEGEDEEAWRECVRFHNDGPHVRRMLRDRGVRLPEAASAV